MCACEHVCMLHATYMEVRGELAKIGSLLLSCGIQVRLSDLTESTFIQWAISSDQNPASPVPQNLFPHPPDIAPEGDSWIIYWRI